MVWQYSKGPSNIDILEHNNVDKVLVQRWHLLDVLHSCADKMFRLMAHNLTSTDAVDPLAVANIVTGVIY